MKKKIIVLDTNEAQCSELCALIEQKNYPVAPIHSAEMLERYLETENCLGVFIDVDTVPLTNRDIRQIALKFTGTYLFCVSKYQFHPELKEAICYHVYACLNRPIDPDELFYWIRSIYQDDQNEDNGNG
jgi:DNA-binding NtrC family response regulator